jgi:cytochrome c2
MRAIPVIALGLLAAGAMRPRSAGARRLTALLMTSLALGLAGCQKNRTTIVPGDPQHGVALIKQNGCGTCHMIPGVDGADGLVGPPLTMMGRRIYIAGVRRNTPENMTAWLQNPQAVVPGNAMPNMGLSQNDARDVTAYLYTLN